MPQHPYEPAPDGAGTPEALPDPPTPPPQPPSTLSRSAVPVAHPSVERRPPRNLEVTRPKTRATMRVDWEEAVVSSYLVRFRIPGLDHPDASAFSLRVCLPECEWLPSPPHLLRLGRKPRLRHLTSMGQRQYSYYGALEAPHFHQRQPWLSIESETKRRSLSTIAVPYRSGSLSCREHPQHRGTTSAPLSRPRQIGECSERCSTRQAPRRRCGS